MTRALIELLMAVRSVFRVFWFLVSIPLILLLLLTDVLFRDGMLTWDSWVEHYWSEE